MSQSSLEILRQHRADQTSLSPASEEFFVSSGGSFFGIFDNSHIEDNKDGGNVTQKKRSPRIAVSEVPAGLIERTSKITREDGVSEFTFNRAGKDDEGVPVLWLY